MKERKILCVTSSKPSNAVTAGGGGGCLTLLDPKTTAVFSSLRVSGDMSGKVGVGLHTLAFFPQSFSPNHRHALGYGYTTKKKDDAYAMLLTFRQASLPPIVHWKTRLPEGQLSSGITVSPCGHYAIGGGNSGNMYVWNTLGGALLRVVKAHYRPIQHMAWIATGPTYLATGGADGMVHVFDLADLVDSSTGDTTSPPSPIRTWSQHHLPITGLATLSNSRLASASADGKVLLLHVPSQKVMATIQMPHKVSVMTVDEENTLYMGSIQGVISIVRLDEYASHQLTQTHGMAVIHGETTKSQYPSSLEQVFGGTTAESTTTSTSDSHGVQYQTELKGHDRPISSLTILDHGQNGRRWLCSGDESGCVRIWDLESHTCIQVTRPWSVGVHQAGTTTSSSSSSHPISSIHILTQTDEVASTPGMVADNHTGSSSSSTSKQTYKQLQASSLVPLLSPLQKFRDAEASRKAYLPVWNAAASRSTVNVEASHDMLMARYLHRREHQTTNSKRQKTSDDTRVAELERQLQAAVEKNERWEAVNNQLLRQLKEKGS